MPISFTRAFALLLVGAVTVSVSGGQPPGDKKDEPDIRVKRPPYTAYPDLKPPTSEKVTVKKADGTTETVVAEKDAVALPPWPRVAADAPTLRKLHFEQLEVGRLYLERVKEIMRVGAYTPQFVRDSYDMTVEVYRLAAELEEKPANRVPWYEARVRKMKEIEQSTELATAQGSSPPQALDLARFRRLQAEIDLTKLKAEIEKTGGK